MTAELKWGKQSRDEFRLCRSVLAFAAGFMMLAYCGGCTSKSFSAGENRGTGSPLSLSPRMWKTNCQGRLLIDMGGQQIDDVSVFDGLPIQFLDIRGTKIADLAPLKGSDLGALWIDATPVRDLASLEGMPLRQLSASALRVDDFSPIATLSALEFLNVSATCLSDADTKWLADLPLKVLLIGATAVSDLSFLKGMQLECLYLHKNRQITDIAVLSGMPLRELRIDGTGVSDLSPLRDSLMLKELVTTGSDVTDFSPLLGLSVEMLMVSMSQLNDALRMFKTHASMEINGVSVGDFWQAGGPGEQGFEF